MCQSESSRPTNQTLAQQCLWRKREEGYRAWRHQASAGRGEACHAPRKRGTRWLLPSVPSQNFDFYYCCGLFLQKILILI